MEMSEGTVCTREVCKDDCFKVQVGLHQGSALSPFLFNIVFDVLTEAVWEEPPWCADDVIIVAKSKIELQRKLERWKQVLESRGMKISRSKTEYMTTDVNADLRDTLTLDGHSLKRVTSFKYWLVAGTIGGKYRE